MVGASLIVAPDMQVLRACDAGVPATAIGTTAARADYVGTQPVDYVASIAHTSGWWGGRVGFAMPTNVVAIVCNACGDVASSASCDGVCVCACEYVCVCALTLKSVAVLARWLNSFQPTR